MSAVITAGTRKAVRKDAALQVFAKRLADVGTWRMVIALAVELAATGQVKPGLEMLGHCAVQQGVLGVARVVKPGFGARLRTRVRMRVLLRWTCGGGQGAVPAWAGFPMILWLYPALCICGAVRG